MSAGIVSACLPTCLPIVLVFLRFVGVKGPASVPGNNEHPTIGGSGGKQGRTSSKAVQSSTQDGGDGWFRRLSDDSARGDGYSISKLRPDTKDFEHTANGFTSTSEGDKDDIPLCSIRVEKEFRAVSRQHQNPSPSP